MSDPYYIEDLGFRPPPGPMGMCPNEPDVIQELVVPELNPDYVGLCITCAFRKFFTGAFEDASAFDRTDSE